MTKKQEIKEFCRKHDACEEGVKWAKKHCKSMVDVWDKTKPGWLIWVATRRGVLDDRTLRLFAVWCCRSIQHLMSDKRSVQAVDVAERYANGTATKAELDAARKAAWWAAGDAELAAAWAAGVAAWAAGVAAWAAGVAAWAAARSSWAARYAAAWEARYAAAWEAEEKKQAAWLRDNVKNPWRKK